MLIESMVAASTARDGPGHGALADAHGQHFAALRLEQLAVVQAAHGTVGRKDHGRGHHGAEQRAAARFIHARYGAETARAQLALERRFAPEFATRRLRPHGRTVTIRAL